MKIPIQYILLIFIEAFSLIKGEKCWMPMVCDGKPTWRDLNTTRQCTKDEEKALKALTERLDGMESKLNQLEKTMEESMTNSVPPSVVDVKETTKPSVVDVKETTTTKDKKTSSTRNSTVAATSSTKESFLSTVRPQTTKVEQSTVTVLACPAPAAPDNGTVDTATALEVNQTIEYSCNAGYVLQGSNIGKCEENGTWGEVPTCVVDLTCDFESSANPTCGYTRLNGTFQREYTDEDVTGYVLSGNGTIRSLPKALTGNEELCMSVDIKGTSDGELVAKAHNGTVTKAIWPFSASTTWKTEKFILKNVHSTDTEVQLELESSGNVELDNITTLNSYECYGLATPCFKRNLENGTISPEQDLYSEDQEVRYSCSNDSKLEGGQTGTCKAEGSWSTTPVCTPTTPCAKRNLEYGTISPEQDLYNEDQEVSYACNKDYILEEGQTGTCKAGGSWSTTPVCTLRCPVVYKSKCFRAIVTDTRDVHLSVSISKCGDNLATIYDVTHYNLLRDYLRPMVPDGQSVFYVHTGMTYREGQLYSSTKQAMSLPHNIWRPDFPSSDARNTHVIVVVSRDPESRLQGIFNHRASNEYHGGICENEL
ncbi:P-selectin-like [Styela clava]